LPIELSGITWNHTRGYLPMISTAQRFSELHPKVSIVWHKRSLQLFADAPLAGLAARFDLMVIDHPSIGEAAHHNLLLPLDEYLPAAFLDDQSTNSVGHSHSSYHYEGHQYALAIDAATPVAGWRPDLLARAGAQLPATWENLLALARRGLVTVPAIPIDSLMNLFMLANALDAEPFTSSDEVIAEPQGVQALQLLRELVQLSAPGPLDRNPIRTWQLLADSDIIAFCPFAYGYSNYSRSGYAANILQTGALISFNGRPLRSTLGGAGLAISRGCKHPEEACVCAVRGKFADTENLVCRRRRPARPSRGLARPRAQRGNEGLFPEHSFNSGCDLGASAFSRLHCLSRCGVDAGSRLPGPRRFRDRGSRPYERSSP
jgi:multiple sugar transport system substrate-binding protein